MTAVSRQAEAKARGWSFVLSADAAPDPKNNGAFVASLGDFSLAGATAADLLSQVESWEAGQAARKPEFRSKDIPAGHPLAS